MAKNTGVKLDNKLGAKTHLDSLPRELKKVFVHEMQKVRRIETQLLVKAWTWERDTGYKLFNFHEGYEALPEFKPLIGSRKSVDKKA